jgi:hypothetical protein
MVEYDPSTWAIKNAIKVPAEAFNNPEALAVNKHGQILFFPVRKEEYIDAAEPSDKARVWLWNGLKGEYLDRITYPESLAYSGRASALLSQRRCTLSADGQSLYWFENAFRIMKDAHGADLSVAATFHAWRTDLGGGKRVAIASFDFPPCKCGTGACSETCPEASVWFADSGVDDFFLITRWIPGQIGATYESSSLFRRSGESWSEKKLAKAFENVEDAARGGTIVIHTILDGACCGWNNVSSDQTILAVNGKETVVFDEFKRYGNPNYDVSFFTSSARLSPDSRSVAMTILSTAQTGDEIRLADQGKPNPEELARIQKSIAGLPAVEVFRIDIPSITSALLPHATLAGWLDDNRVLVVENGLLVALDVRKGDRSVSPIKVASESYVFLR